ncbi:hypothetical protein [Clostridium sp. YIM B02555]|uniref:hypothetical protein n=1 Tax=Clostridium sp. YIM B02555 TaxID=2911968 RepID=UPI001EED56A8|nr:hypothetical protein [Clostridium sp. YIM B02555]
MKENDIDIKDTKGKKMLLFSKLYYRHYMCIFEQSTMENCIVLYLEISINQHIV